jgi:hypothetical protein
MAEVCVSRALSTSIDTKSHDFDRKGGDAMDDDIDQDLASLMQRIDRMNANSGQSSAACSRRSSNHSQIRNS